MKAWWLVLKVLIPEFNLVCLRLCGNYSDNLSLELRTKGCLTQNFFQPAPYWPLDGDQRKQLYHTSDGFPKLRGSPFLSFSLIKQNTIRILGSVFQNVCLLSFLKTAPFRFQVHDIYLMSKHACMHAIHKYVNMGVLK